MRSLSIGAGRITEGELELTPRPNNASGDDSELFRSHSSGVRRRQSSQSGVEWDVGADESKPVDQSIIGFEEPIMLTQSTHSFLFTEPTWSVPFFFALAILGISYTCLSLALLDNIFSDWSSGNPFNAPVGVDYVVKIAQYLALLIGLIMEEEIPESLYLLRMINEKTLLQKDSSFNFGKFIFCAILRIVMGYLFYFNMFVVVAQATDVVEIFFDVMALQFLQQVDDIAFRLAKMDVFGKRLKKASTRKCFRAEFEKLPFARRKKMSIFVKVAYLINLCVMMVGMTIISVKQSKGSYQCKRITVKFDDNIWEDALVLNATGGVEKWDLIYGYFNGVYELNGTHNGRPVYTEQNKFDNNRYQEKIGAAIKYCKEERAWVLMHENIRKDISRRSSECPWLLRSPETKSFNLLEVSGDWSIWTGIITTGAFQVGCNACDSEAECNYHGKCLEKKCVCDLSEVDGYNLYSGPHCEFSRPCARLSGNDGDIWDLRLLDTNTAWRTYGRGVYRHVLGGNLSVAGSKDALMLVYSGSRWLAFVYEEGLCKDGGYWLKYSTEFHPFWDKVYSEISHAVSNPTFRSDPIAVDFFRIGRRGPKYGPLGELIPAQDPPGAGFFECALNISIADWVVDSATRDEEARQICS